MINKHPLLKKFLKYLRFITWRLKVRIESSFESRRFDPGEIYWVDSQKIEYYRLGGDSRWSKRGKIVEGDWDQHKMRFMDTDVFRAFQDRFTHGKNWRDTEFYHRVMKEVSVGKLKWECRSKEEFDERCKYLDFLFQDIKNNGYKSQEQISRKGDDPYKSYDEVAISIDRDGQFLFEDGRHRLAITLLLGINKIPVQIVARHSKWCKFKQEIIDYAKKHKGRVYQPLTHPDLRDIPSWHGEKRFHIIKEHLPVERGDFLDIGAHWGYFCHKFREEGFTCCAVESDPTHVYFLKKLKKAENENFKVVNKSILEYQNNINFDVVLALNIFHHFLKEKKTHYQLIKFLKRLLVKVMFFEPHLPTSPQMKGAYVNYNCEEFVHFILENSCLNKSMCIGEAEDGRPIYKIYN